MNTKHTPSWSRVWAIWLTLVAASFAALEATALTRRKPGDTLSENLRRWLGTEHTWRTWGALGFTSGLVGFVAWFVPHIVWHLW